MKNRPLTALLCGIALLITSSVAIAAEGTDPQKSKQIPTVRIQKVVHKSLSTIYEGTGSIEASRIAQLASPAEGPVVGSTVREGDAVKAGDILISLGRNVSTEAFMQSALADLKKEEDEVRRIEQLVSSGAIPGEQRAIARANLQKARAQVAKLQENMEDFRIKAPWDGIVNKVLVRDGNFVGPRAPLVELYDPKSLVLRFSVPESQVALVKHGILVEFHLDAYKETPLTAKVVRVYPELDRKTRTLTLEAAPSTGLQLKPGMFARLQAHLGESAEALVVPTLAVRTSQKGEQIVFVVKEVVQQGSQEKSSGDTQKGSSGGTGGGGGGGKTGLIERRVVTTGVVSGDSIEIVSGLAEGEFIVTEGGEKLKDGAEVRIAPSEGKGKN